MVVGKRFQHSNEKYIKLILKITLCKYNKSTTKQAIFQHCLLLFAHTTQHSNTNWTP